jgi:predicted enzyme related to lactoylglutathione lyase
MTRASGNPGAETPEYESGAFCWVGLATADTERAKAFYSQLFGWRPEGHDAGAAGAFTLMRRHGEEVAIVYRQTPEARVAQVTSHWTPYILVENADATAARAAGLGAAGILREPFEALGQGRVAPIRDPTGAIVSLWQPRARLGATLLNDVGALGWIELVTADIERAKSFYAELLGWEYRSDERGYVTVVHRGRCNGGMRQRTAREGGAPGRWLPHFTVANVAETVREAQRLGALRLTDANGRGRSALLADPQGAAFMAIEHIRGRGGASVEPAMRRSYPH